MKINSTVCPHHILMAMPLGANYAAYCIGKYEPKTLDELAGMVGRLKTIELLNYLARNYYAEISRVRYGRTKSGFGIVIHYGSMSCGDDYHLKTFNPFESKEQVTLPYNKGFASFANHHVIAVVEQAEVWSPPEDDYTDFCRKAMKQIVANNPGRTINTTEKSINAGAVALRLLANKDGYSLGYVMDVICWGLQDSFWKKQIFSMAPLRGTSKNGLKKFENIANAYIDDTGGNKRVREFGEVTINKVEIQ